MTNTEEPRHGSWADVDQDSARFRGLLEDYDNDYQRATDAYLRGEEPKKPGRGPANPM